MTWSYRQSDGQLTHDGVFQGYGYSGTGDGRNNPDMQSVPNVGPITKGTYVIGPWYDDSHLGPCVMHLDPTPDTNTFGRTAFRIHGDNKTHDASHGCIILGPDLRHLMAKSDDRELVVV